MSHLGWRARGNSCGSATAIQKCIRKNWYSGGLPIASSERRLNPLWCRADRDANQCGEGTNGGRSQRSTKFGVAVIEGFVKPGFQAVRDAFLANFEQGKEAGAACCIYHMGEKVVDLWGGIRNKSTGELWEADTMASVFSSTKGLSALALALAKSRGFFRYEDTVSRYWPEFAQYGKGDVTIRQLLAHQAGLFAIPHQGDRKLIADLDRLANVLAQQTPAWTPGSRQAYHAITLGYYENELLRRVDAKGRSLGQFFQQEIATPLGLDFYIRLPNEVRDERLATVQVVNPFSALFTLPVPLAMAFLNPCSIIRRAVRGSLLSFDNDRVYARNFEMPAVGGVGTARAIARAYSVFATGGDELGVDKETLCQLSAPPIAPSHGFHDAALKVDIRFSLGFARPGPRYHFGSAGAFGHPGAGGSFGFADPESRIGYGYVPNRMGGYLVDPRDKALRRAMYQALGLPNGSGEARHSW